MQIKEIIPAQAKKVFSGVIFDTYQWQQQMFDGSYQTFEAIRRTPCCFSIPVLPDGRIVVLQEEQPHSGQFYGFPGGRLESGELPETTAARELKEETGLQADSLQLLETFQISSKIDFISYVFLAKNCQEVESPKQDAGERIKILKVNFKELCELIVKEDFRDTELKLLLLATQFNPDKLAAFQERLSCV